MTFPSTAVASDDPETTRYFCPVSSLLVSDGRELIALYSITRKLSHQHIQAEVSYGHLIPDCVNDRSGTRNSFCCSSISLRCSSSFQVGLTGKVVSRPTTSPGPPSARPARPLQVRHGALFLGKPQRFRARSWKGSTPSFWVSAS